MARLTTFHNDHCHCCTSDLSPQHQQFAILCHNLFGTSATGRCCPGTAVNVKAGRLQSSMLAYRRCLLSMIQTSMPADDASTRAFLGMWNALSNGLGMSQSKTSGTTVPKLTHEHSAANPTCVVQSDEAMVHGDWCALLIRLLPQLSCSRLHA